MKNISELLPALVNVDYHNDLVKTKITEVLDYHKAGQSKPLAQFFGAYTSWNGFFASGVVGLTAKITNERFMFMDPEARFKAVADRSNHIASFVFDAAREEYHDCGRGNRASHRALAQAFMIALLDELFPNQPASSHDILLSEPVWLQGMNENTPRKYLGEFNSSYNKFNVFAGMGYHIGSEWLADREFTIIDQCLQDQAPDLRSALVKSRVEFSNKVHKGYTWITAHSGDGDAVEQEHYEMAIKAAELALQYTPEHERNEALNFIKLGIMEFANSHKSFFTRQFVQPGMRLP